ncbi:MAG TPA: hypothetical protein DGG95_12880 [Cytophagales bacterium]|jgi:hypothetical protein|nr:hypothetical protein [Cytophagales bacterium]
MTLNYFKTVYRIEGRFPNHPIVKVVVAIYIAAIAIAFILLGCEPAVDPTRQFLVRKGEHYASPKVSESLQSNTLAFDARFNESAIYNLGDNSLQSDKNKLMGFCDCNSMVHENSARFAWQWFNNQLEIYAYCYVNGTRMEQFVGVVQLNEYNHYQIERNNDAYVFTLNNEPSVAIKRGGTCNAGLYYKLWPYFGGHIAAPHDVIIDIKTIY